MPPENSQSLIVATLEGDVHDLGKSSVKMVLIGEATASSISATTARIATLVAATASEAASGGADQQPDQQHRAGYAGAPALHQDGQHLVVAGGAALKQRAAMVLDVDTDYLLKMALRRRRCIGAPPWNGLERMLAAVRFTPSD